jgi:hypothetical protein
VGDRRVWRFFSFLARVGLSEFIDENGGGPGVRLCESGQKKRK